MVKMVCLRLDPDSDPALENDGSGSSEHPSPRGNKWSWIDAIIVIDVGRNHGTCIRW